MAKQPVNRQSTIDNRQFFEIVNWKAAQPNMPNMGNDWLKLYTSLLEHDGFAGLDDTARMLIVSLWLYAARSGLYILPADPKWIWRKIPMLNSEPDIEPLVSAQDAYGKPTPFLAYCRPPGKVDNDRSGADHPATKPVTKTGKKKRGTAVATRTRGAQRDRKRVESREERREKIEDATLSGCEREKEREKKERVNSKRKQQQEEQTEQRQQTAAEEETAAEEPDNPVNPMDSEAGSAKTGHILPKSAPSAFRRGSPQRIGSIIGERFPEHWQDPDAEAFGWEIVEALGYSTDRHNIKSRSEWGAFAAWWCKSKKVVPSLVLDELRATAVRKADYLRTKGKSAKNPSAVWFHIMNGKLNHRGMANDKRARAP